MIPILQNPILHKFIADEIIKASLANREDKFRAAAAISERKYRVKLREVFSEQLDEILGNLQGFKSKALDDFLIDWSKYRIIYNEFGQYMLPEAMSNWANIELEALEVGISFDVTNPYVESAILNRSNRFADDTVNTTRDMLHKVVNTSIQAGEGPYQLEKRIRQLYSDMSKYRAIRIARTETIWAQNEGAERGYIQSGVVEAKQWLTARDERTCPWCFEMGLKDPIIVGINYFNLGESLTVPKPVKASDVQTMTFNYEPISHPPLHPHCYSDDTEIYTKDGWRLIKDVVIDEFVLSLNPLSKDLEWCKVLHTVTRHADKIYHIINKQKSFDMLVTEDHPFFIYKRHDHASKGRYIEPQWVYGIENLNSESTFYLSSRWFRLSPQFININGIDYNTQQFCKFMGYYLSEGSVVQRKKGTRNWYQISIAQSHYLQEMWDDLQGIPVRKMWLGKDRITILDEGLAEYLVQFGKSYEKYIPAIIKELSPYDIRIFLNAFRMGDGTIRKGKKWKSGNFEDSISYTTCSKRLADELGELIIKSGKSISYSFNEVKDKECKFKNGTYIINHNTWTISELTSQYRYFSKMQIKEVEYDREVYDLEVEKYHTILIRRNGRVVWGSNCRCCLIPIVSMG